jgi:uncharacterized protein YycO
MRPANNYVDLLLYRGRGWGGRLITWQTRSPYSHAAVCFDDGTIVESLQGRGVIARPYGPEDVSAETYRVGGLRFAQLVHGRHWLWEQIGKPYDYLAILRFVTRRRHDDHARWFCSELVFEFAAQMGVRLLERTEAWEVSPGMLARSPLLRRVDT